LTPKKGGTGAPPSRFNLPILRITQPKLCRPLRQLSGHEPPASHGC
jgi:hypothetical protein